MTEKGFKVLKFGVYMVSGILAAKGTADIEAELMDKNEIEPTPSKLVAMFGSSTAVGIATGLIAESTVEGFKVIIDALVESIS